MTQNRIGLIVYILSFLLLGLNARAADIPMLMNYQGSVTDAVGVPVNGDGFFKFAIVNEAGDTAYWANDGATMDGTEPTTAITIPVSDGRFSVKLGDTDLANMTALSPSVFDNTRIYLRVWFSIDELNFEKFATDMQVVSTGFAFKAKSVGYDGLKNNANTYMAYKPNDTACTDKQILTWDIANSRWICDDINIAETDPTVDPSVKDGVSWSEVSGIPAGFTDGTDDGITSESDPTVVASVKDGVSWPEVSGIPAGFADGTDDGITSESDPTVDPSVKDGVSWTEVSGIPAGFADGVDDVGGSNWTVSGNDMFSAVSGNVGIGTTSPGVKLDVSGSARVSTCSYWSGTAADGTTLPIAGACDGAGDDVIFLGNVGGLSKHVRIYSGATERIRITQAGLVGIGDSSPAYRLVIGGGDVNTTGGGYRDSGSCVAGTCASDRNLKINITPLVGSLEKLTRLEPVSYEFIDPKYGPGRQDGLIAQDVAKVFPEWVSDSEEGYKTIKFGLQIQMHLIQALKELKRENDNLKARVMALEAAM